MPSRDVPARGDIIWIEFAPQAGHEQSGRRPGLVISATAYNDKVGLALVCPITNQIKGYPFEVVLPPGLKVSGAVLADQIKSLDWRARKAKRICPAPPAIVDDVLGKVLALMTRVPMR
jgi:mRNA interferase MazF